MRVHTVAGVCDAAYLSILWWMIFLWNKSTLQFTNHNKTACVLVLVWTEFRYCIHYNYLITRKSVWSERKRIYHSNRFSPVWIDRNPSGTKKTKITEKKWKLNISGLPLCYGWHIDVHANADADAAPPYQIVLPEIYLSWNEFIVHWWVKSLSQT